MNVIIFGAGISGLTAAHELIEKGFSVTIYEKDSLVGGMARSNRTKENVPTEHSWRGYAPFYYNTFDIMKRIPINNNIESFNHKQLITTYKGKKYDLTHFVNKHPGGHIIMKAHNKNLEEVWEDHEGSWHKNNTTVKEVLKKYKIEKFTQKTVYDNLSKKGINFILLKNNKVLSNRVSPIDLPYLIYTFSKVILSEDRKKKYYKENLNKKIKKNISKKSYYYLTDYIAGPGFGLDKNTMSTAHFTNFMEKNIFSKKNNNWSGSSNWTVLNQPTNEGWLNPWKEYLQSKGVKFIFNSELYKLNYSNNKINYVEVKNNNLIEKINSDIFIVAINPFEYQDILQRSNLSEYKRYQDMNTVNNQISFRLGFDKKINFKNNNDSFVLIDSPYNITFYNQEQHWEKGINLGMNGNIKTLCSGTCILPYRPGSLTKKSAMSLKLDELKEEIIHQFFECKSLLKIIEKNNNIQITKNNIIFIDIFDDFYETETGLKSKNKKWVNNFYNEEFRPSNITKFNNLYIAGSHTKTSINLWSMESAVESGKMVSNILLKKYNKQPAYIYNHSSPLYIKPFQKIDNLLYKLNLPQLIDTLIILIFIYLIYKIYIIHH